MCIFLDDKSSLTWTIPESKRCAMWGSVVASHRLPFANRGIFGESSIHGSRRYVHEICHEWHLNRWSVPALVKTRLVVDEHRSCSWNRILTVALRCETSLPARWMQRVAHFLIRMHTALFEFYSRKCHEYYLNLRCECDLCDQASALLVVLTKVESMRLVKNLGNPLQRSWIVVLVENFVHILESSLQSFGEYPRFPSELHSVSGFVQELSIRVRARS